MSKSEGPLKDEGGKRMERISMIQSAKTTFCEEMKCDRNTGKSSSKTQFWRWTKL